jgi:hypothetical protein
MFRYIFLIFCLIQFSSITAKERSSVKQEPSKMFDFLQIKKLSPPIMETDFIMPIIPKEIENLPRLSEKDFEELRKIHLENVTNYSLVMQKIKNYDQKQ